MTECYVYKWTHKPSLMWYVGSRTAKKSNPFDGYICSSKTVKPMILANPVEWTREIIAVGSKEEMIELERDILETFDARNDPHSFNQSNGLRPIAYWTGKKRSSSWNKGLSGEQTHRFGKTNKRDWRPSKEQNLQTQKRMLEQNPNKIKLMCPVCDKQGAKPAMKRFHFEKCGIPQKWKKNRQGE